MNIPQSTIEPFGYTGMPTVTDLFNKYKDDILDTIINFINQESELQSYFTNESVRALVTSYTLRRGAINPECRHVIDGHEYRIFDINFGIPNCPRRISFGFGIKHKDIRLEPEDTQY